MPVPQHQILMGVGIAALCLTSLVRSRWLLVHTRKGQYLVERHGEPTARIVIWLLCLLGMIFGTLLACGIVRPISW